MKQNKTIRRALLSVSNKKHLKELGKFLIAQGVEIISTGGTATVLGDAGIEPITPIEKVTGSPEAFQGRMKTLSFPLASSLLFRRDDEEDKAMAQKLGIEPIDLVVCNFYPFAEKTKEDQDTLIENIDIGGPTIVRAAAKNFSHVAVLTSPEQYKGVVEELSKNENSLSLMTRKKLAAQAFRLTAQYEITIAQELNPKLSGENFSALPLSHGKELRYGENPHQKATYYRTPHKGASLHSADIVQGKPLSYNNLLDADSAHRAASDALQIQGKSAVAIVKHLSPCGLAVADSPQRALELAWEADPTSAFGSVLCFTDSIETSTAQWLKDKFIEVLVAPSIEPEALEIFTKKKNLRILLCPPRPANIGEKIIRSIWGGVLIQEEDEGLDGDFKVVTQAAFPQELRSLAQLGAVAAKHLKSNAIALVQKKEKALQLIGTGMGQPNRIDSLQLLAIPRAREKCDFQKVVLASDAFFPFSDIIEAAAKAGISLIVQPGGSIRDQEVIDACNKHKIAMAFTSRRHFRH